jgi:FkbM family methyltransferase
LKVFRKYPFARKQAAKVLFRILRLQFCNKILRRTFVFHVYDSVLMVARSDFGSPVLSYYLGLYERGSMSFLLRFLRKGDLFADVGANVGVYSILAAGACGARVEAFEPVPSAAAGLRENVMLNNLSDLIFLRPVAVGSSGGQVEITTDRGGANCVVETSHRGNRTARVEVISLNEHFRAECPIAMKIDVEGYESRVLAGAEALLRDHRLKVVIVEAIPRPERDGMNVADSVDILRRHDFANHIFDVEECTLHRVEPNSVAYVSEGDENYLFIRDADFVQSRLHGGVVGAVESSASNVSVN